jgi:hypothetical protein
MSYPVAIGSIADVHPILTNNPRILNHAALNGVFSSKNAGDALDNQALLDADQTIKSLESAHSERFRFDIPFKYLDMKHAALMPDLISNDVVQSSKTRLHAMRGARMITSSCIIILPDFI